MKTWKLKWIWLLTFIVVTGKLQQTVRLKRAHYFSLIANLKYLQILEAIPSKHEQWQPVAFPWQAQRLNITILSWSRHFLIEGEPDLWQFPQSTLSGIKPFPLLAGTVMPFLQLSYLFWIIRSLSWLRHRSNLEAFSKAWTFRPTK